MKRMKYVIVVSTCVVLLFMAVSCGGESPAPDTVEPSPAPGLPSEPSPAPEPTPEPTPEQEPEPVPEPEPLPTLKPAEFRIAGLTVSPAGIIAGENSRITVDVTNVGEVEGDYEVVLKTNGSVVETKKLTLAAGVTETAIFVVVKEEPGTYNLTVNELSETLTVIAIPDTVSEIMYDVEYGRVGDISLLLDMYIPETRIASPTPAIVCIHGGWSPISPGDKGDGYFVEMFEYLANHGFVVASINYRYRDAAPWPAQVEDSKYAVRWLKANADEYNIDPDRIGVWGVSSGGYLAAMVGCVDETAGLEGSGGYEEFSSSVRAVCTYTGSYDWVWTPETEEPGGLPPPPGDLPPPSGPSPVALWLGGERDEIPEKYEAASATSYVNIGDPPLLIICGDMDYAFPGCEYMIQTSQVAGLDAALIIVNDAGHALVQATDAPISPSMEEIEELRLHFFIKHLLFTE